MTSNEHEAGSLYRTQGSMQARRLGLVLGAGGVRGCAHGGVLFVLAQMGIRIDCVVGASIGAMFGLGVAAGIPIAHIAQAARETSSRDLMYFYGSRLRPTGSNRIARMFLEACDGKTFADLEKPFAVVATNMETGEPEVIDSGPVLPAVQASIALPFIARAVNLNGRYYLDGGIRDATPVWAARAIGAETVIAVYLGGEYVPGRAANHSALSRGLRRFGTQRRAVRGNLMDQVRFSCRLFTSDRQEYEGGAPELAIKPNFAGLRQSSMFGAAFSYHQGVTATENLRDQIERLVMPSATATASIGSGHVELRPDQIIRD